MTEQIRLTNASITYAQLICRIETWNIPYRLVQKYSQWHFKYSLPILSSTWIQLIKNSLVYYILKSLHFLLSNYTSELLLRYSFKMKEKYSSLYYQSSQNKQQFDFYIMIMVKLITYFIASHIPQLSIDEAFQNEIYKLIIRNLLGVNVQNGTYKLLLKKHRTKRENKRQRESLDVSKQNSCTNNDVNHINKELAINFARRNGYKKTTLFCSAAHANQEINKIEEMKHVLKQNLYVKPIVKPISQKYNIRDLQLERQSQFQLQRHANKSEYHDSIQCSKHSKFTIQSNQLSQGFQIHNDVKLKDVKSFSIHCSPAKQLTANYLKNYKKQTVQQTKIQKVAEEVLIQKQVREHKNWNSIVSGMKEKLYAPKINQNLQREPRLLYKKIQPKCSQFIEANLDMPEESSDKQVELSCTINSSITSNYDATSVNNSIQTENLPRLNSHIGRANWSVGKIKLKIETQMDQNLAETNLPRI